MSERVVYCAVTPDGRSCAHDHNTRSAAWTCAKRRTRAKLGNYNDVAAFAVEVPPPSWTTLVAQGALLVTWVVLVIVLWGVV